MLTSLLAFCPQKNSPNTSQDIPDAVYLGKSKSLRFSNFKIAFNTKIYIFAGLTTTAGM